jgi:hypothetical protein
VSASAKIKTELDVLREVLLEVRGPVKIRGDHLLVLLLSPWAKKNDYTGNGYDGDDNAASTKVSIHKAFSTVKMSSSVSHSSCFA